MELHANSLLKLVFVQNRLLLKRTTRPSGRPLCICLWMFMSNCHNKPKCHRLNFPRKGISICFLWPFTLKVKKGGLMKFQVLRNSYWTSALMEKKINGEVCKIYFPCFSSQSWEGLARPMSNVMFLFKLVPSNIIQKMSVNNLNIKPFIGGVTFAIILTLALKVTFRKMTCNSKGDNKKPTHAIAIKSRQWDTFDGCIYMKG